MAPLIKNVELVQELGNVNEIGVLAAAKIFEGAAVSLEATGFAQPLVAGEKFLGFAESQANNSAGLDGAIKARLLTRGRAKLAVAALVIADVGKPVYASDDNTFTLTQGINTYIGRVTRFISAGVGVVAFDVEEGGTFAELTAAIGTPSDTIADVTGAFDQAILNNNFKSLADKVNNLLRMAKT